MGGRREMVQHGGEWRLQGDGDVGEGVKCSVVLRPTDPLDNASTGVTDLPHTRNSRWYDPLGAAAFLGSSQRSSHSARSFSIARVSRYMPQHRLLQLIDRCTTTVNGSAQASEDGADRLSIWNAGIGFRLADPGARGFDGIYCAAVYTRRAGMRSRGDWERALPKNEIAGF